MDQEAKKILQGLWADSGDRTDPDDSGVTPVLDRETGFPASYSADPGEVPKRPRINQRFRELDGAASDSMRYGGVLPWDPEVDYAQYAHCSVGIDEYVATVANGPGTSNSTNPSQIGQTVWALVRGEINRPEAPDAPSGTAGDRQIRWDTRCPSDGGAQIGHFDFQWRIAGGVWSPDIEIPTPHYLLTGLQNGSTYEARIRATNSRGDSPWSGVGSASPVASAPSGGSQLALRAEGGDARAVLSWLEPENNGAPILDYTVQWRSGTQVFGTGRQAVVAGTSHTVTGLQNGTEYFFRVRARNSAGSSPWSNEDSTTPVAPAPPPDPDTAPLQVPSAPMGTVIGDRIVWSWDTPDDGGQRITGYDLQWRVRGQSWSGNVVSVTVGSYILQGVSGTTYEARVRARNSIGIGSWSATGSVAIVRPDLTTTIALPRSTIRQSGASAIIWQSNYRSGDVDYARHGPLSSADNANISSWAAVSRYVFRVDLDASAVGMELGLSNSSSVAASEPEGHDLPATWEVYGSAMVFTAPGLSPLVIPGPNNASNRSRDASEFYQWRPSAARETAIRAWIAAFRALSTSAQNQAMLTFRRPQ